jgi:hypothetical protein
MLQISDLMSEDVGTIFIRGSDPHPPRESTGAGTGFISHPWVTCEYPKFQFLIILTHLVHLNFHQPQSFGLAQYYPPLRSRIIILGSVHLTHQLRFSLVYSIHRALVIEFTFTLLKSAGDPKPNRCRCGCDFSPMDVAADGFRRVPRV